MRHVLPLPARQALATAWRRGHLPGGFEFSMGLLDDLRQRDPDALHRFLWSNHLAYAKTYEIASRFGAANINPTRHLLFHDVASHLRVSGFSPERDIRSVFEIGCSMGYLLRHLEAAVFPSAEILHGIDIDAYAIETGSAYLASQRSKVALFTADMESADRVMAGRTYDVVLCCGVLMYVNEAMAGQVVRTMLAHAARLVGVVCLAHSDRNNTHFESSEARALDGTFIHNVHRMIRQGGGRILSSKWVGTAVSGSSPSHVIVAEPPAMVGRW